MENEKRLIDANKISYHKSGFPKGDGFDSSLDWAFREDIEKLPTVDAVEVVRCKDCFHLKGRVCCNPSAGMWVGVELKNDDFCSYGERRDGQMNREQAEKVLDTVLRYTQTNVDYVYDTADGGDEIVPGQDIADAITVAIAAIREQEERRWIPVAEGMPEEHDSIFVKFYGTDSWMPGMFLTTSDNVIAAVICEDGSRCAKVMRTMDGKWHLEYALGAKEVTHWMPLPEPPKGCSDA